MKPKRILLIRHAKSDGNADKKQYETLPDYALNLTSEGVDQARQAGIEIRQLLGDEKVYVYLSPYYRTRQTYACIRESLEANIVKAIEDPRLREQDWGHLRRLEDNEEIIQARDSFSPFYYRIPDGESGADVYDRLSTFLETLHRDFEKPSYPPNVLIITHGIALRLFLMRWFHWSVEEFENLRNPRNCQIVIMQQTPDGHYALLEELAKRR